METSLYHDKKHQSSLILTRRINGIEVRGILNHEFTITPAFVSERSSNDTVPHNISAIEKLPLVGDGEDEKMIVTSLPNHTDIPCSATEQRRRSLRNFTVELWVIVSSEYRAAFNTCEDFLTYLGATVNAVALRFINMTNPKIQFQLNGVTTDYNDTLTKDTVCYQHREGKRRRRKVKCTCGVDAKDTLNKTRFFINSHNIDADLVYFITSKNLVSSIKDNGVTILQDVQGFAYISGVCTPSKVGVGEDKPGTYSGVTAMAHEIAHLLGSWHDGEGPRRNTTGHPGGTKCDPKDGYLMGDWAHTRNEYRLSECTKKQIQYNFRCLPTECIKLRSQPKVKNNYYSGELLDHLKYCQVLHPDEPDVSPEDRDDGYKECRIHCCWKVDYQEEGYSDMHCHAHRMLEAMDCGHNKTCRRGVCGAHNWTDIYKTWRTF
uniref:Reprolysin n=1 Tax=Rhipicephalus zambeziensis TaxID=60191 RepID=A0A224YED7_9ACAR